MKDLQFIIERINTIIKDKKTTANKTFLESGVGKDFFYNMRKGQTPSVDKFSDLADYLDCSVDYLLGRTAVREINRGDMYE